MSIIYQIVLGIMIVIMGILLVALLIVGGGACLYTWFQKKKKRVDWNKMYDNIQRGDLFIENLHESNPYKKQWGRKVEIIDKRVNNEGIPYIKYLELDCPFESTDSTKLEVFIEYMHYEPYNNQDIE